MFKRRLRLPSPAIVIAMLALALVLGGTAIAAGTSTPLTKKTATKLIKKLAPTLDVKSVGGQQMKSFYRTVATGDAIQESVLSWHGLTITLSCAGGEPTVEATAAQTGAFMRGTRASVVTGVSAAGTSNATAGTAVLVFPSTDHRGTLDLHYLQTDGHRVDIDASIDDTQTINGFDGCLIEGYAVSS
jgi:hypothetical protein